MIGGILILFIYLTRISNNELLLLNKKYYLILFFKLILILFIYFILIKFMGRLNFFLLNYYQDIIRILKINEEFNLFYKNLYIKINIDINIYIILYLFFTIIIRVLICIKNYLPLRQITNNYE